MKLIKLTQVSGEPVYINTAQIVSFAQYEYGQGSWVAHAMATSTQFAGQRVKESPEEIAALLEGNDEHSV